MFGPYDPDPTLFMVSSVVNAGVYGIYMVIFGICTHILIKRGKTLQKYTLLANAIIFAVASLNLVFMTSNNISLLRTITVADLVADIILMWRCYIVWGKKWRVVIFPLLFYFGFHVVVLAAGNADVSYTVGIGGIALNNLFLSCLIARQVTQYVKDSPRNMYRTVIAATLESGVIYAAFLITIAALQIAPSGQYFRDKNIQEILFGAWPSVAGITTSLVIVRVSLGIAFNDLKTEIMTVRGPGTVQQQDEEDQEVRGSQETEGSKEHTKIGDKVLVIGRDIESGQGITTSIVIVRVRPSVAFNDLRTEMTTVGALEVDRPTNLPQTQAAGYNSRTPEHKSDQHEVIVIGRDVESRSLQ
ncbi:hypothetical protein VNI00_014586 [Paramarasmius palmivorus]|uniref:Uncharacterized protein n=1 Tax=Paramarasmius palmivorus TaxID=297713 RepID=A0AAW0BT62_9AGAR